MKDQDDKFPGRAPFNEKLEATFKCRVIMPLEIMEGDVRQEQKEEEEEEEEQQQQQQPDMGNQPEPRQSGGVMLGEVQEMEPIPIAPEPILPQLPAGMSEDASAVKGILGQLSEGKVPSTLMEEDEDCVVTLNLDIE